MTPVILLYVQNLLGTGHLVRTLAIAHALLEQNCHVHIAYGGMPSSIPYHPDLHLHQLPSCQAEDLSFKTLIDDQGHPLSDMWKEDRKNKLLSLFDHVKPDVFISELFPFGRRAFRFELLPLLGHIKSRSPHTRLICSLRDILTTNKAPNRNQEVAQTVNTFYDLVLVHGDESFVRLDETFPLVSKIADKILYTGYVSDSHRHTQDTLEGADEIIVSAGGGSVGERLYRITLETSLIMGDKRKWRILTGPHLPQETLQKLQEKLPPHVILERYHPHLPALLKNCKLSISQAGYNTVTELISTKTKAILIPFSSTTETEQTLRAHLMDTHGLALHLPPHKLTPRSLADAITSLERQKYPKKVSIDTTGAYRSARLIKAEGEMATYNRMQGLRVSGL